MTNNKDLAVFKGPADSPEARAVLDANGSGKIVIMSMKQYLDEQEDMRERIIKRVMATPQHASDCALHNMPAMPNGPCDCGVL